ncbi:hypothetical protein acdb102_29780 [Acidothermaceae bacterium B102]|nr:hypothetical protein acdb102_29780 [Acidothermaceae bacterium B102]
MHRSRIPYGRRARVVSLVAAAAMAAIPLAVPGAASAAAPKNTAFTIGHGADPSIVVAKNGTAFVTWVHQGPSGNQDQIQFCKVPRGKRACTGLQTFSAPLATGARPQILMPNPTTVYIVYYQYAGSYGVPSPDQTWLLASTDAGATFAAPVYIGTQDPEGGAALDANGGVYLVIDSSTYGITVQRDNLNGTAIPAESALATFPVDWYGGNVAVTPTGQVFVSSWNETNGVGTIHLNYFSGTGDPNATASWTTALTQGGEDTQLGNGPKGPYLFFAENAPDDPRFAVEKLTSTGDVVATFVTPKGQSNEQPTFWEDASGRLNLAYWQGDTMLYKASDLKGWQVAEVLGSSGGYHQRGATAADGGGFVAYDDQGATGPVSLVPIPVRRTISETVKAGKLSGKVLPGVAHQPVQLQVLVGKHWVVKKTASTSATGAYSFAVTAKHTYRAVAPLLEGYAEADGVAKKH